MSDPTTPKSQAELLAECCRVLWPEHHWIAYEWFGNEKCRRGNAWRLDQRLFVDSLDTYAALVAAMSPGQRLAYDQEMGRLWGDRTGPAYERVMIWPSSSKTMLAPTATHLAAACAALGVRQ